MYSIYKENLMGSQISNRSTEKNIAGWDMRFQSIIIAGGFCPIFDLCGCDSLKGVGKVLDD